MTTDEFFASSEATRLLVQNLRTNLKVYVPTMKKGVREALERSNLIMIRQCLEDCGYDPEAAG